MPSQGNLYARLTSFQTAGITGLVDPSSATLLFQIATGSAGAPSSGTASWPFTLPNSVSLDNLDVFTQIVSLDAGGPLGLAASDGMRFRICSR